MGKVNPRQARQRRHHRVRLQIKVSSSRPRLCVFRSLNHVYAQIIDDVQGHTLVSASSLDPEIKSDANGKSKTGIAELVGTLLSKRASSNAIKDVAFDRGGYKYHGRVKALAEAARQGGLKF